MADAHVSKSWILTDDPGLLYVVATLLPLASFVLLLLAAAADACGPYAKNNADPSTLSSSCSAAK